MSIDTELNAFYASHDAWGQRVCRNETEKTHGSVLSNELSDIWYVYVVRCCDESLYTGVAKEVRARVALHNRGVGAKYTKSRRPVELVYVEPAETRGAALRREHEIKKMPAVQKRELVGGA